MEARDRVSAELEEETSFRFALGESQESMMIRHDGDPDGFSCRHLNGAGILKGEDKALRGGQI
jgi:hypothetical protein